MNKYLTSIGTFCVIVSIFLMIITKVASNGFSCMLLTGIIKTSLAFMLVGAIIVLIGLVRDAWGLTHMTI